MVFLETQSSFAYDLSNFSIYFTCGDDFMKYEIFLCTATFIKHSKLD